MQFYAHYLHAPTAKRTAKNLYYWDISRFFIFIMTVSEKHSIFELLAPILDIDGIELVDVETQLKTLRLLIHKPGGLSVSDCQAVNSVVQPILEVHEHLANYTQLEVASPGLDRPLRTAADFRRNRGRTVRIEVASKNDKNCQVQGTVVEVSEEKVILVETNGNRVAIHISEIHTGAIHLKW